MNRDRIGFGEVGAGELRMLVVGYMRADATVASYCCAEACKACSIMCDAYIELILMCTRVHRQRLLCLCLLLSCVFACARACVVCLYLGVSGPLFARATVTTQRVPCILAQGAPSHPSAMEFALTSA